MSTKVLNVSCKSEAIIAIGTILPIAIAEIRKGIGSCDEAVERASSGFSPPQFSLSQPAIQIKAGVAKNYQLYLYRFIFRLHRNLNI